MDLKETPLQNAQVVELNFKRLDAALAESFKSAMVDILNRGVTKLVLDLSKLEFMDSSGLAAILSSLRSFSSGGGEMVVCGAEGAVLKLFQLTKLEKLIKICASKEQADQYFG